MIIISASTDSLTIEPVLSATPAREFGGKVILIGSKPCIWSRTLAINHRLQKSQERFYEENSHGRNL
jgi:hypothetical protein